MKSQALSLQISLALLGKIQVKAQQSHRSVEDEIVIALELYTVDVVQPVLEKAMGALGRAKTPKEAKAVMSAYRGLKSELGQGWHDFNVAYAERIIHLIEEETKRYQRFAVEAKRTLQQMADAFHPTAGWEGRLYFESEVQPKRVGLGDAYQDLRAQYTRHLQEIKQASKLYHEALVRSNDAQLQSQGPSLFETADSSLKEAKG